MDVPAIILELLTKVPLPTLVVMLLIVAGIIGLYLGFGGKFRYKRNTVAIPPKDRRWAIIVSLILIGIGVWILWMVLPPSPEVPTPTGIPKPSVTAEATSTPTPTATVSPTATLPPTWTPSAEPPISTPAPKACADGAQGEKPCVHEVRPAENYSDIALYRYGNACLRVLLMSAHRSWSGTYNGLTPGQMILVPDPGSVPTPEYGQCQANGTFPCLFRLEQEPYFPFEWMATLFYSDDTLGPWISSANLGACGEQRSAAMKGEAIVIPVPPLFEERPRE